MFIVQLRHGALEDNKITFFNYLMSFIKINTEN